MSPITTSTEIDRPAPDVFDYATDPTRFSEWQKGVIDGHMDKSAGAPRAGDICLTTRRIGGANRPATSRITHIDPPRTWGVHGINGPIRATVDLTVEPLTDTRSRLTIAVDFEGHGIGKVLVPLLVRREAAKEMPTNLAALKRRLETAAV
ncbi:MAG TPA: SRPBCC family protein [Mycobacterium sp.]